MVNAQKIKAKLALVTENPGTEVKRRITEELVRLRSNSPIKATVSHLLVEWQKFYREVLGIEVTITGWEEIPPPPEIIRLKRLMVMEQGLTAPYLFRVCQQYFPCTTTIDLDSVVSSPTTDETRVFWIKNVVPADQETANLSANDLQNAQVATMTLEERILLELKYNRGYLIRSGRKEGRHLDRTLAGQSPSVTLCAGSRDKLGRVPTVSWNNAADGMMIGWQEPNKRSLYSRARVTFRYTPGHTSDPPPPQRLPPLGNFLFVAPRGIEPRFDG